MNDIGKPLFWSLDAHIQAIIQMIRSDELQIALKMCDDVPAYYRENYPKELTEIKQKLYKQIYTIFEYGNDDDEAGWNKEEAADQWFNGYCHPRAEIITEECKKLNANMNRPWIFDLSCSHGNLPLGLLKAGIDFTYLGRSMNHRAAVKIKDWIGDAWQDKPKTIQPKILVCTEALEHAWDPQDIVRAAYKENVDYDQIFLSTPLGCLYGGLADWDTRRLGHVRGWGSKEFMQFASDNWPGYEWKYYKSHSQVLHGKKSGRSPLGRLQRE